MSANSSLTPPIHHCFDSSAPVSIFMAFTVTKALLCGCLSVLVFYVSGQRRRRRRPTATASHSDVITYHMAAMELICLVACVFYFYGSCAELPAMTTAGLYVLSTSVPGEMCFHSLTCVERYLAVVHPVVYRGLRRSGGVRLRNISLGCVWLLCLGWVALKPLYTSALPITPFCCFLAFSLLVVSFCSLSVLCTLVRPGPGDVGGDEKHVDQSKQRAFHTVAAILAALWLWFVGILVCFSLESSLLLSLNDGCVVMMSGVWFGLPSSLVLPLLFLNRAGKLTFCHHRSE